MEYGGKGIIIFAIYSLFSNKYFFTSGLHDSYVNVALGKQASQSSTYVGQEKSREFGDTDNFLYSAYLAVDGNNSTNFGFSSCSHTGEGWSYAWWEVDLNGFYRITKVVIFLRSGPMKDYSERNPGSIVSGRLADDSYIQLKTLSKSDGLVVTIPISSNHRFKAIRIHKQNELGRNSDVFITLCEVQVFGDKDECMDHNVCSGRGRCIDTLGSFICECTAGYTGQTCYTDADECRDHYVCSGHGKCINTFGSFSCECTAGYTGKSCNTVIQCMEHSAPRHSNISYVMGIEMRTKTYNSTVSLTCDLGYSAVGNTLLRCSKSGEWDGTLGHCVEKWSKLVVAVVAAAVSVTVAVLITLLILWRRRGFRFGCNRVGPGRKEEGTTCTEPDSRMDGGLNNIIQSGDADEIIYEEPQHNVTEMSEYLELTGIETENRENHNPSNEFHTYENHGNNM